MQATLDLITPGTGQITIVNQRLRPPLLWDQQQAITTGQLRQRSKNGLMAGGPTMGFWFSHLAGRLPTDMTLPLLKTRQQLTVRSF